MRDKLFIVTLVATVFLYACSPQPMLSNLHKGPYGYDKAPDNILAIGVGILPIAKSEPESEKPRLPWDLRDSIPNTLVKTLGTPGTADALMTLMAKPIPIPEKKEVAKLPTDYTQHKVLITFSNIKRYFLDERFMHPNTRLEFLNMELSIPNGSNFSFHNIDKLINEYDEIDLGSLERNKSITFNGKISGQADIGSSIEDNSSNTNQMVRGSKNGFEQPVFDQKGNEVGTVNSAGEFTSTKGQANNRKSTSGAKAQANAELSYQNTESIKEAMNVKLKRMKTGFSFAEKKIVISQRGRVGGDVSDNIYVTATLKFTDLINVDSKDVFTFSNLFDGGRQRKPADQVTWTLRNVGYVPCRLATNLTLNTNFEGAIRAVGNSKKKTGENSLEYDDDVTYYTMASKAGDPLTVNANVYCKRVYKIVAKAADGNEYTLRIAAPNDKEVNLFSDDQPHLFLQWVIDAVQNPDKTVLSTKKFELYFERAGTKIYLVKDGLTDADVTKIKQLTGVSAVER